MDCSVSKDFWMEVVARKYRRLSGLSCWLFVGSALPEKPVSTDLYVLNLEIGNEIMSGSGLTWVKSFSVVVK